MSSREPSNRAAKSPEEWLEKVAPEKTRGTFKLFLGYAPGVGKTYNMLSEAIRRRQRGEDIVIGVVETHGRPRTAELAEQLEQVPRQRIEYKGVGFEEMDLDGILARRPQIVLIDELAHTNIEGSKHRKRYEDVLDILAANIDVLATMNVQHIESVAPTVQSVTGIQIRETVPDWLIQRADEIVMADLTPEALQTRMRRGDIYGVDRAEKASGEFLSPRQFDRSSRAGFAACHQGRRPHSDGLYGCEAHRGQLGRARTRRGLHQRRQLFATADRARCASGRRRRRRTLRAARRHRAKT